MRMTNQTTSRIQVACERCTIRYSAEIAPKGATIAYAGVRNARGRLGSRTRSTMIPTATITNASNVPIETRLAAARIGRIAAKNGTMTPVIMGAREGGENVGSN